MAKVITIRLEKSSFFCYNVFGSDSLRKYRIKYLIITILFILCSIFILQKTNLSNNVELSKAIQIILILFLIRISYGCTLYIRKQYAKRKYSYGIIMNLGLLIFINVNILS